MALYSFDQYGWYTGIVHDDSSGRVTSIMPPDEDGTMKANFTGLSWVLLNKAEYMATHFPPKPALVITSCTVDDAHSTHADLELDFNDGEITVPAGAAITVHFEIRLDGVKIPVDKKWRVPIQPVDFKNQPNGNARFVFARVTAGVGSVTYQTKDGQSEKLVLNEEVVNSGFRTDEPRLTFQALNVFVVE